MFRVPKLTTKQISEQIQIEILNTQELSDFKYIKIIHLKKSTHNIIN